MGFHPGCCFLAFMLSILCHVRPRFGQLKRLTSAAPPRFDTAEALLACCEGYEHNNPIGFAGGPDRQSAG